LKVGCLNSSEDKFGEVLWKGLIVDKPPDPKKYRQQGTVIF